MFHQRIDVDAGMGEIALLPGGTTARGWLGLIAAMIGEVQEGATDEQLHGFFHAVGGRMAGLFSLAGFDDLDEIVGQINGFWSALGWGGAIIELDDEGIDVHHSGMPTGLDGTPHESWAKVAPYILEGVYESWFRSLGSGPTLSTRLLKVTPERIDLRHGY